MTSSWSKTCPSYKSNMSKATIIESLPDELIFEILVRVPAQNLYDSTRLVCRKWYNMINTRNFAHSHLQRSTPGLISVDLYNLPSCKQTLMTMQKGQIETSNLSYGFGGTIFSSCNGLILGFNRNKNSNERSYIIVNPVTKQHFALPRSHSFNCYFSLSYVASSGEYKVVSSLYSDRENRDLVCVIMTVGVDTDFVRRVSTQHLSLKAKEFLYWFPLTTPGFVHWVPRNSIFECVLTMNVESEIITQIPGPCLHDDGKSLRCHYLPMGSYLSLLIDRGEFLWEVWKMKPETGEWTNMPRIVLESQKVINHLSSKFKSLGSTTLLLKPFGWSNSYSGEVLFFGVDSHFRDGRRVNTGIFVVYNIRTREFDSSYPQDANSNLCLDHKSSLVWLD
ncbi:hypothetical protein CASFOL_041303 [Castilleja foliolosa]|uniref:F-box domain-containing protein n=1 Tax=Castilleja foliolosa TaxID=1961234 RepID=A0ABD3BE81_9LAMI